MKLSKKAIGIGILILSLFIITITVMAAVDLLYFLAESGAGHVLLKWETASELNNAGYYVARSLNFDGPYQRITGFIPARGDGITGAYYEVIDTDVVIATMYYYVLEIIDTSGVSEFTNPVSILYGVPTRTPTSTLTRTPSGTPTSSPTTTTTLFPPTQSITPTGTATRVRSPTRTATIFRPQPTLTSGPGFSPTPHPGNTLTPTFYFTERPTSTTTLIPLPTFTLLFPESSVTSTPTLVKVSKGSTSAVQMPTPTSEPVILTRIGLLGGVILLLWLLLSGLLVYLIRHIG